MMITIGSGANRVSVVAAANTVVTPKDGRAPFAILSEDRKAAGAAIKSALFGRRRASKVAA